MYMIVGVGLFILFFAVVGNFVLTLALAKRVEKVRQSISGPASNTLLKPGRAAPDFEALSIDGSVVRLKDFTGRGLAMVFFSPDCGSCTEELPQIKAMSEMLQEKNIDLVMIDLDGKDTKSYAAEHGLKMDILIAPQGENPLYDDYNASYTPSFCLLNPDGTVHTTGLHMLQLAEAAEEM